MRLYVLFALSILPVLALVVWIAMPSDVEVVDEAPRLALDVLPGGFEYAGHGNLIILNGDDTYSDRGFDMRTNGLHIGGFRYQGEGPDNIPMLYLYEHTGMLRARIVKPAHVFWKPAAAP